MELLTALAGAYGDRVDAIRMGTAQISYADLAAAADRMAARIAGAPAVAISAEPDLPTLIAIVAALRAGVPVVPMPTDAGPDEIAYMLADAGAYRLRPDATTEVTRAVDASAPPVIAAGTALILYTSGTTGRPKGVQITAEALASNLDALAEAWAWTPDDVLVHGLPLSHVHGLVLGLLGPLRHGSRLVHTVRPTPAGYAAGGGTLYFGVPTVWSRLCAEPDAAERLRSARLLVSGSAPLPVPVFERLTALTGHRPVERYGMTETLITCSTRVDGERRAGSVGTPLTGVRTRLAPFDGADIGSDGGPGELGALEISGPGEFVGYLGRPDATAEAYTADGWFRTGDIATIDADGMHRIVGRASIDLIKTGGYRVGAGEVEDALLAHPAVREAAVIGVPDNDLGQRIVAFVVGDAVDADALGAFVVDRLSWHKRPRSITFLDALPRNGMGKVMKSALR